MVANILSGIAIGVSALLTFITFYLDSKRQKTDLNSEIIKQIYWDLLLNKIPENRRRIHFDENNLLKGTDKLINNLQDLLSGSTYFSFVDEPFYKIVKEKAQKIEDYLVNNTDHKFDSLEHETVLKTIRIYLEELYSVIDKKYSGKKFRKHNRINRLKGFWG